MRVEDGGNSVLDWSKCNELMSDSTRDSSRGLLGPGPCLSPRLSFYYSYSQPVSRTGSLARFFVWFDKKDHEGTLFCRVSMR